MLKIVGLCLIFLSSVGVGFYSSRKLKTALQQAKEMLDFINYIKQQIEFFNTPLNEIYSAFENQSCLLSPLVKDISHEGWNMALKNTKKLFIPEPFLSIVKDFGENLGKTNKKDQLEKCEHYIQDFEKEYEKLKITTPEKIRTSLALSVYGGLMIIILFL